MVRRTKKKHTPSTDQQEEQQGKEVAHSQQQMMVIASVSQDSLERVLSCRNKNELQREERRRLGDSTDGLVVVLQQESKEFHGVGCWFQ